MTHVDRVFKRGAYKRNNREGEKSFGGDFQGALTRGYINGSAGRKDELGSRGFHGWSQSQGGNDSPLIDRRKQLEWHPASVE